MGAGRHYPYRNNIKRRQAFRLALFNEQGGMCHLGPGCYLPGQTMTLEYTKDGKIGSRYATFDHLIPVKLGGTRHPSNFGLAHKYCNSKRGHKDILLC